MTLLGGRKATTDARRRELERPEYGWIWKPLVALAVIYLLVTVALGIWWSREPPPFDVEQATGDQRQQLDGAQAWAPGARGTVATATLMTAVGTLIDKPGGYLRNDVSPPGVWLDNMPNWEYGVLRQSRDLATALVAFDGRADANLEEAESRLQVDSRAWLYPSAEQRFEQALDALGGYLGGLGDGDSVGFAPQGDVLSDWLTRVEVRLDDLSRRLSASVGERKALRELGMEAEDTPSPTPWYRIDDIFFEARGSGWALKHFLQGVERDYADVIEAAEARELWHQLIAELTMTQRRIWSPVILNGSGFGLFANHSLVMANHTVRARDLAAQLASRLDGVSVTETHAAEEEMPVEPPVEEVTTDDEAASQAIETDPIEELDIVDEPDAGESADVEERRQDD